MAIYKISFKFENGQLIILIKFFIAEQHGVNYHIANQYLKGTVLQYFTYFLYLYWRLIMMKRVSVQGYIRTMKNVLL
jgi:hypothetical protein